jgi:hypothetical protein
MLFSDLLKFEVEYGHRIPLEDLEQFNLKVPQYVLEQFYSDHGSKYEFQDQYGHLDISSLKWVCKQLPASELISASIYSRFEDRVISVSNWVKNFEGESWNSIDTRKNVIEHWTKHKTWLRIPIFLDGNLLDKQKKIHLVEGHTRLGALRGLVKMSILPKNSLHKIWYGYYG